MRLRTVRVREREREKRDANNKDGRIRVSDEDEGDGAKACSKALFSDDHHAAPALTGVFRHPFRKRAAFPDFLPLFLQTMLPK